MDLRNLKVGTLVRYHGSILEFKGEMVKIKGYSNAYHQVSLLWFDGLTFSYALTEDLMSEFFPIPEEDQEAAHLIFDLRLESIRHG